VKRFGTIAISPNEPSQGGGKVWRGNLDLVRSCGIIKLSPFNFQETFLTRPEPCVVFARGYGVVTTDLIKITGRGGALMERIMLVGGVMLAVGLALAGVFVVISFYGSSFEAIEDSVVRWLGMA
jgi:hypothetical protein